MKKILLLTAFISSVIIGLNGQQVEIVGDGFISGQLQVGDLSVPGQTFLTVGSAGTSISGLKLRHVNDDFGFTIESNDIFPTQGLYIRRHVGNSGGVTDMVIDLSGNVGIGVIDPDAKLEVDGQIKITGGNPGSDKVLVSDANGLASWAASPPPPPTTYTIGDFAQGGVVFWVSPSGEHGKVVSIYDVDDVAWSNITSTAIGNSARSNINGGGNTVAIILQSGHTNSAAKHCADLGYGGYDDWYLASKDELNEIYQNEAAINITATANGGEAFVGAFYWSSTENSLNAAWMQNLVTGGEGITTKDSNFRVRAIRAF